jgi:hypothetical protein
VSLYADVTRGRRAEYMHWLTPVWEPAHGKNGHNGHHAQNGQNGAKSKSAKPTTASKK